MCWVLFVHRAGESNKPRSTEAADQQWWVGVNHGPCPAPPNPVELFLKVPQHILELKSIHPFFITML